MPWQSSDATRHTKKATSPVAKRQWAHVADGVLAKTGNEGLAVREANGVIDRRTKSHRDAVKAGKRAPVSHDEFHRMGS